MDAQEWIEANALQARRALADPAACAELLALLGADHSDRRRERRLEAARRELETLELRWKLGEGERWSSSS